MKEIGKALIALYLLVNIPISVSAADSLKIHLTYKHKLDKEGHTKGRMTVRQKFFTPEQQLFREINYNEVSGQITDYTFYFYKDGKLFTEECYSQKDSLMYILKHEYDATGREKQTVRLEPRAGSLQSSGKTVLSYDKAGKMVQEKKYFGNKAGSLYKRTYDKNGNLLAENRKFKPVSENTLKAEKRTYSYKPDMKVDKVLVTGKDMAGNSFRRDETYAYDDKGNLSTVTVSGNDMPEGLVKTYRYLGSGLLSLYEESNAAGIFSLILQYDYKKHFMDKGTQVSYFDAAK